MTRLKEKLIFQTGLMQQMAIVANNTLNGEEEKIRNEITC